MLKRRLGRTNFLASVVGFGGISIQHRSREEAVAVVRRAVEFGVNFVDTARSYTDSEDKIGEAIQGLREKPFLSTKSHLRIKSSLAAHIEESRRRLGVDKIDLYFLHGVDSEGEMERCLARGGVLEAVKEARGEGRVDFIGISGHDNKVLAKAIRTGEFDVLLASYNLTNDDAARELFPLAEELDVGVVVMKPLAGGSLAVPEEARRFRVADKAVTTAATALRFVLSNPRVSTVIPGMATLAEVEENVPLGFTPQQMSAEEVDLMLQKAQSLGFTFCQGCGYCLPCCPEEIDIQAVFRLLSFHQQYGMVDYAQSSYRERHQVKVLRCNECELCMERCPAGLEIPVLLKRANAVLGGDG